VYLFDKRTKVETPSKAYLRILEETLKAGHPALYHLNTKTLNSTQVIALLSRYNIDVPKYHNKVDKIRRSFKQLQHKTVFKVVNLQKAYDNDSVFHISIQPVKTGLTDITDESVKIYFAKAIGEAMTHVRELFTDKAKHPRDGWRFILFAVNDTNGYSASSGPPSKIDGAFLDRFLERVQQFIISSDVHDLKDISITVKGYYAEAGGAITGEQRLDLF